MAQGIILFAVLILSMFSPYMHMNHEHRVIVYDNLFNALKAGFIVTAIGAAQVHQGRNCGMDQQVQVRQHHRPGIQKGNN